MGTWGLSAFGNDNACDWSYDLAESEDLSLVESALKTVEDADGYLEAPDAEIALAACEVLARLKGHPGEMDSYSESVDEWVAAHKLTPTPDLLSRADSAIARILGENSELLQLWSESEELNAWLAMVQDLRVRLQA